MPLIAQVMAFRLGWSPSILIVSVTVITLVLKPIPGTILMADKFDPYREALIVETNTIWPDETEIEPRQQAELAALLHASPEEAAHLEYVRTHTGFCRQITVTDADLERVSS